jgi:hypothetical protein
MSKEFGELKPIVIAERLNTENLLCAFLDSPILRTRINIGKLNPDGNTATVGKRTIQIDNCQAAPGDTVVTYEII